MPAEVVEGREPRVESRKPDSDSRPATPAPRPAAAAGPAVFTTVEEDLARRQHQQSRPWTSVAGSLLGLALALAAIAGLGLYLSRPLTADRLYEKISRRADADDVDSMREVEREISEFVTRFHDDARAAELEQYQQRIELDRMNRRLQLQARRGGLANPSLLPVEVLYLEAMNTAQSSPESAIDMLQSLIRLYGADAATTDAEDRRALWVQSAERQLVQLREDVSKLTARQLTAIRERMTAAEHLAKEHPDQARDMYQAIIDLYGDRPWAAEVVAEARRRLEARTATND
jgi:serine/threonine-protein kinase